VSRGNRDLAGAYRRRSDTISTLQLYCRRTRSARGNPYGGKCLKITLILAALAGLSGAPLAHAQSSTAFIGLRETYWNYVADPSGEHGFRPIGHCQEFGLGAAQDLEPPAQPFFLPETGSTPSTDHRFGATASKHARKKPRGFDRATFLLKLPLPWCGRG
jgi:hypothetical protein